MPDLTPLRRRASRMLLAGACVAVLAIVPATVLPGASARPTAGVRTQQTYVLPASGTFTIRGRGFGHGHGMSQYGAQGAALRGLSAAQILAFYYPGTTLTKSNARIAVLISSDTTRDVQVRTQPGLTVRDRGSGSVYPLPTIRGVTKWRLNVSHARAVVAYYTKRWHRYHLPDGRKSLVGDGQFSAPSHVLTLVTPYGDKVLRGTLRAASPRPGSTDRDTVNVLSLDKYVKGVVAREMPASWQPAAVQAQAVAARTYALWSRTVNLKRYYQICDTTACQVYDGVAAEYPASNLAVNATAGQYLSYQGRPAFTQFASSSGGWTSAGSVPYLPHQADPYDDFAGNPVHKWTTRVSESVLERRYPKIGDLTSIEVTSREGDGQWQGRVLTMTVTGATGSVQLSGDLFRSIYGLRSSWFRIN